MNRVVIFALIFWGVLSLSANDQNWIPCKKTYVPLERLAIHEKGIFVRLGNNWVQTPMIRHDIHGLYVDLIMPTNHWVCDICTGSNPPWEKWCLTNGCSGYRSW